MMYFIEQFLNGVQLGMLLFLLAAGLTLIFGIMDIVNLAHGSLYMIGAYFAATFAAWTDSFVLGAVLAILATLVVGMVLEVIAIRRLYGSQPSRPSARHFRPIALLQRTGSAYLGSGGADAVATERNAHSGRDPSGRCSIRSIASSSSG